jgi:hypothetical protein
VNPNIAILDDVFTASVFPVILTSMLVTSDKAQGFPLLGPFAARVLGGEENRFPASAFT